MKSNDFSFNGAIRGTGCFGEMAPASEKPRTSTLLGQGSQSCRILSTALDICYNSRIPLDTTVVYWYKRTRLRDHQPQVSSNAKGKKKETRQRFLFYVLDIAMSTLTQQPPQPPRPASTREVQIVLYNSRGHWGA